MLYRKAYEKLREWNESDKKKALCIFGARQIGKTTIIRHFGAENYENMVEINFVTDKDAATITDKRIVQKYENSKALKLGVIQMEQDGGLIKIYSKERMLLELIRNKNNMPFDYYKEILNNYRRIVYDLNIQDIQDYADKLPKNRMIMETLRLEVF